MNIFVKNLSSTTSEADLDQTFGAFGVVSSSAVIKDKDTGASRGFGFVAMPDQAEAESAIAGLHGKELERQVLTVRGARSLPERIERAYRRASKSS